MMSQIRLPKNEIWTAEWVGGLFSWMVALTVLLYPPCRSA